jgi:hypothetical protein
VPRWVLRVFLGSQGAFPCVLVGFFCGCSSRVLGFSYCGFCWVFGLALVVLVYTPCVLRGALRSFFFFLFFFLNKTFSYQKKRRKPQLTCTLSKVEPHIESFDDFR